MTAAGMRPGQTEAGEWLSHWLKDQLVRRYDPILGEALPPGLADIVAALRSDRPKPD